MSIGSALRRPGYDFPCDLYSLPSAKLKMAYSDGSFSIMRRFR
jgi:hypothetical protein